MPPELLRSFNAYRQVRADELYEIANLLEEHGMSSDAGPVRLAAQQCLGQPRRAPVGVPDAGRLYWGYEIAELTIKIDVQRHCRPRRATMAGATGKLSVKVQEYVPEVIDDLRDSFALLRRLDSDFFFDAAIEIEGAEHKLRSAWHVDTHVFTQDDTHSVHPRFHFQVGGDRLDDVDDLIRGVFMPETPRVACAPLDGPLAIDFVLSHYCGEMWMMLRAIEPRYARVRHDPMRRYWQPYYRTLTNGIGDLLSTPSGGDANALQPSIFIA